MSVSKSEKGVFDIFQTLGFNPKIYNYKYDYETVSMIHLNGKKQCKLFLQKIGFKHPIKQKKLKHLL